MKSHINEGPADQTVVDVNTLEITTGVARPMEVAVPKINQLSVGFGGPQVFDENLDLDKLKIANKGSALVDDGDLNAGDLFNKAADELILPFGETLKMVPLEVVLGVLQAREHDDPEEAKLYQTALEAERDGLRRKQKGEKVKDGTWYHSVGFIRMMALVGEDAEYSLPTQKGPSGNHYAQIDYECWKAHEAWNCARKLYQTKRFGPFWSQAWDLSVEKCAGEKRGNTINYFYSPSVDKTELPAEDMQWIAETMQGGNQ